METENSRIQLTTKNESCVPASFIWVVHFGTATCKLTGYCNCNCDRFENKSKVFEPAAWAGYCHRNGTYSEPISDSQAPVLEAVAPDSNLEPWEWVIRIYHRGFPPPRFIWGDGRVNRALSVLSCCYRQREKN